MDAFPSIPSQARANGQTSTEENNVARTRTRRASSNLGGDPRGDTSVGSLATRAGPNNAKIQASSKPSGQRTRPQSLFARWKRISFEHTWVNPLLLLVLIASCYFVAPGEQNPLRPALFLSYADPPLIERTNTLPPEIGNVTQYGKGKKDFVFVAFYTVFFTFTREFLMQRLIRPIAIWCGIKSAAKQSRFLEQFYTAIYFAVFGPFGLWIMSRTPVWYFRTAGMYADFPHRAHESYFKAYYLLQASYWAQQAIVLLLQLEKPRKDFKELVLHHIVTLSLVFLSYRFHFTYVGIAVYVTHDVSDFFLASVKVLNYIESPIVAPYYTMFICIWAYLRHYINLSILYSMLPGGEFETIGRYDLSWPEQQYKCLLSQCITFALLAILQTVNLFWFFLICRILYRIAFAGVKKDERSDDEEDVDAQSKSGDLNQASNGTSKPPVVTINGKPINLLQESTRSTGSAGNQAHGSVKRRP